jgi:hypothetical protein
MQVGFIANLRNERSHIIVEQVSLQAAHSCMHASCNSYYLLRA